MQVDLRALGDILDGTREDGTGGEEAPDKGSDSGNCVTGALSHKLCDSRARKWKYFRAPV